MMFGSYFDLEFWVKELMADHQGHGEEKSTLCFHMMSDGFFFILTVTLLHIIANIVIEGQRSYVCC